jgi:hypothetical protein
MKPMASRIPLALRSVGALMLLCATVAGCTVAFGPAPVKRKVEAEKTPREACFAQCRRGNDLCLDQRSTHNGGSPEFGMNAICRGELERCEKHC